MDATAPLSERLRNLRLKSNLTIESLSELSGVSVRTISDIERRVSNAPHRKTMVLLAEGLSLDAESRRWLLQPTRAAVDTRPGILPLATADFVGRSGELDSLVDLPSGSLVVVSGLPGIGKTALVVEAIRRRGHGAPVLFTDLAGETRNPTLPLQAMQNLLRQADSEGVLPSTFEDVHTKWKAVSAAVEPIVILDNVGRESQVRPFLVEGLQLVVVTSRRNLSGLDAARWMVLDSLPTQDSESLLKQIVPESQRTDASIRELVNLCNGSPLALRIAGNHIASRPNTKAGEFAARLRSEQRRLRLLVAGDLSVEAAFALSYDGLDTYSSAVFRAISLIEGRTFAAELAAAAAGNDLETVEDILENLVESGLLEATEGNRYRMHDLMRLFGRSRMDESGTRTKVTTRLRNWLLLELSRSAGAFLDHVDKPPVLPDPRGVGRPKAEEAGSWIRREVDHWWPAMRSAAQLGEHAEVARISVLLQEGFAHHWVGWGNWTDFFEIAVESARKADDSRLITRLLGAFHWASVVEHDPRAHGVQIASEIIDLSERTHDDVQLAWGNLHLGWALLRRHRPDEAMKALDRAQNIVVPGVGALFGVDIFILKAAVHAEGGEISAASDLLATFVAHANDGPVTARQRNARMASLEELAAVCSAVGHYELAIAAADAQLASADQVRSESQIARALINRARILVAASLIDDAAEDLARARRLVGDFESDAGRSPVHFALMEISRSIEAARSVEETPSQATD